jgi:hypothetical protein
MPVAAVVVAVAGVIINSGFSVVNRRVLCCTPAHPIIK